MSGKVRVYQVARDLGVDNKSLVALFQSVGVTDVKNHMSAVAPEAVDRVKRQLARQGGEKAVEEQIRHGVVFGPTLLSTLTTKTLTKCLPLR